MGRSIISENNGFDGGGDIISTIICPKCNAQSFEGQKKCWKCGTELPRAVAQPVPPAPPAEEPDEYFEPKPPAAKSRAPLVIAGAIIGAVIIAAILIAVVVLSPPVNPYPLEVGDFFRYTYSGTTASLSGTITYEVMAASALTYTFRTTYTGDIDEPSSTDTASAKGSIGKNFFYDNAIFIRNESISTHYGTKLLKLYLQTETDCDIDIWADQGMDVPYKMVFTYHDASYGVLTLELTETNIEWMM